MTDYRSFSVNGAPAQSQRTPDGFVRKWWTLSADEAAKAVASAVSFLAQHQSGRQTQLVVAARLYGNASLMGAPGSHYAKSTIIQSALRERVTFNAIQSGIDTIVAKMAKNKPRPFFVTDGGSWDMQKRAKKLNRFMDGIFYEAKADEKRQIARRDAAVWGDGILHVYAQHGRVMWERALPHEFYVDELEGMHGDPRSMTREKAIDRGVLMDLFPSKSRVIADALGAQADAKALYPNIADLVTVRESWHLPSGPEAEDGRHLISIDDHALTELEEWEHDFFPFARFQWSPRLYGYWSQGGAEQVQALQMELNTLSANIQRATKLSGMHYWLIENGAKVAKSLITNQIGTIIPFTGSPPQAVTPPIVPQEIYAQVENLKRSIYEQLGVSTLSASSTKPAGLNSGAALREFNDIESDRFQTLGKEDERFAVELSSLSLAVAKDIAEEEGEYEVNSPSARFLRTVKLKADDLDVDGFVLKCFPVSSLPNEPAGRLQTIQELVQAGMIPPSMAPQLMQMPDLDAYDSLAHAMEDRLEDIFDRIVEESEYAPPEPWLEPTRARELCLQYLLRGESQGLAPERLEMLQTFLSQLDMLEQAAGAATPGITPQAQPSPQPVSDLVPNAPGVGGLQ